MRRTLALVTLAIGLGICQTSQAVTFVPKEYPQGTQSQSTVNSNQLPATVAIYQNQVVLLAGNPEGHSVKINDVQVDANLAKTIKQNAGNPVTLAGIIQALEGVLKDNPTKAVSATVAALKVAKDAGLNGSSLVSIVVATIQTIPSTTPSYVDDVAALIGFAVASSSDEQQSEVIRQLRAIVISESNSFNQSDFTLALDQALAEYHIIEPKSGNEEFLAAAATFIPDISQGDISEESFELSTTFFQILTGNYSPGGGANLVPPFTGGANGTPGNPGGGGNNTPQLTTTQINEIIEEQQNPPSPDPAS